MPPLLYVVGWVRLLTVLVVICIRVVLVWRLKDDESVPQVELKLLSDLKYSQFLSLLSSYVADPTCFLLVLLNSSLALVKTRLWSLPTCPHLCALVSSREITTLQFWLHLLRLTHKHTHKVLWERVKLTYLHIYVSWYIFTIYGVLEAITCFYGGV